MADATLPIVAVVGATAVGKSDLAVDLALELGGEVINTDSMQLYRGMDIGTAKLPLAERRGVPHHLLDVLDVTETATVAEFQAWARAAVQDCRDRGRVPVLVGGSALYLRAVLDEFEFPGTDPELRVRLQGRLDEEGAPALHRWLARARPGRRLADPARQRSPGRAGARGHRAHRAAVHRDPAGPGVRRPAHRPGRPRRAASGARRARRAAGREDVGRRPRRGGTPARGEPVSGRAGRPVGRSGTSSS